MEVKGGWVLEVDVCQFLDTIDHTHLREFVSRRVRDGVLRRLIDKWLRLSPENNWSNFPFPILEQGSRGKTFFAPTQIGTRQAEGIAR